MDAEGLGRKLLLTRSGDPQKTPEKQSAYCHSISKNANPASTFELSQCWRCKGGLTGPRGGFSGAEKWARSFFAQTFWTPPGVRDIPAKFPGHPGFLSSKPKEDKVPRAGTKFSATAPSRGRPPPHRAVSGPKNLIFVLFFLAWFLGALRKSVPQNGRVHLHVLDHRSRTTGIRACTTANPTIPY